MPQIKYGYDYYSCRVWFVKNSIRKPLHDLPPYAFAIRRSNLGKNRNPLQIGLNRHEQFNAASLAVTLEAIEDGLQFGLCSGKQIDAEAYREARMRALTSDQATASSGCCR